MKYGVAARQMCTPKTITSMCPPGTLTWELGGGFWGCFEGVLGVFPGCSAGVPGLFWTCSPGPSVLRGSARVRYRLASLGVAGVAPHLSIFQNREDSAVCVG